MIGGVWKNEAREMRVDQMSGARIIRLADGGTFYCESPLASPDGRRILIDHGGPCVCDLQTLDLLPAGLTGRQENSPYSEYVYFWQEPSRADEPHRIERFSLLTLKREPVIEIAGLPKPGGHGSNVSPNGEYLVYQHFAKGPNCRIIRVNLKTGEWDVLIEDRELLRHLLIEPGQGDQLLVQVNRGAQFDETGKIDVFFGKLGATHFVVNMDGTNRRPLPVGEPHTSMCSGHSAWIGKTHRVALAIDWVHNPPDRFDPEKPADWTIDPRFPGTTLITTGPGESVPRPFPTPEHRFFHVSVSRCGRYFICNSSPHRRTPTEIVVGNFATGKYRILVENVHCYQYGITMYSVPYLTANLQYAIYQAKEEKDALRTDWSGFGAYAAHIPAGFLESLD